MCVFDGLLILLLVSNTNDTGIKLKNRLFHFTCTNSITVNASTYISSSIRLQFDYYHLNSPLRILYAFLICPM